MSKTRRSARAPCSATPKAHRKHNENSGSSHGFLKIPQATETLIPSVLDTSGPTTPSTDPTSTPPHRNNRHLTRRGPRNKPPDVRLLMRAVGRRQSDCTNALLTRRRSQLRVFVYLSWMTGRRVRYRRPSIVYMLVALDGPRFPHRNSHREKLSEAERSIPQPRGLRPRP